MTHIFHKNNYVIGLDFGLSESDISVMSEYKICPDGTIKILKSKRLGLTKEFSTKRKDEIIKKINDFISNF